LEEVLYINFYNRRTLENKWIEICGLVEWRGHVERRVALMAVHKVLLQLAITIGMRQ